MEIKPSEGIAQILELIGSVTVAAPADYTKNIHIMKQQPSIYMGKVGEAVKHAATWVKITKTDLQATGCTGGSFVLHPLINAYPSARSDRKRGLPKLRLDDGPLRSCGTRVGR